MVAHHTPKTQVLLAYIATIILFLFSLWVFWPGLVTYDSVMQYRQAVTGQYSNTHPPVMAAIWRALHWLHPGASPMLLLNLMLYWAGWLCVALYATGIQHRVRGILVLLGGLFPFLLAFAGVVWKDVLLAASWGLCSGILLLIAGGQITSRRAIFMASAIATAAILLGAAIRHNAAPAAGVLVAALVAQLPISHRVTKLVMLATLSVACFAIVPLSSHILRASDHEPFTNVVSWDLTGISYFSGRNYREPGHNSLTYVEPHCYSPRLFDACPVIEVPDTTNATELWTSAIRAEPLAYLKHRALVSSMLLRFGCRKCGPFVWVAHNDANPFGMAFKENAGHVALGRITRGLAHTPIGRPYLWLVLAAGLTILVYREVRGCISQTLCAIGLSGIIYAATYSVAAVTDEFRYLYWLFFSNIILLSVLAFGTSIKISRISILYYLMIPLALAFAAETCVRTFSPTDHIAPSMTTNY